MDSGNRIALTAVLAQAYDTQLERLGAFAKEGVEMAPNIRPPISEWAKHPIVVDTIELSGWVYPEQDAPAGRKERAELTVAVCDANRVPFQITDLIRGAILKPKKGAPIKPAVRKTAILALEEKRFSSDFSWMRFALAHCPCDKPKHNSHCKESIRRTARDLQRLMVRLGIIY